MTTTEAARTRTLAVVYMLMNRAEAANDIDAYRRLLAEAKEIEALGEIGYML